MSQVIWLARAVAITDRPGIVAVAVFGPHVVGVTSVHSHTGTPTRPVLFGVTVIPIAGPASCISPTAHAARSPGVVAVAPYPSGGPGNHDQPVFVPGMGSTQSAR